MNQSSHYGFRVVHILGNVGSIPKNAFLGPIWRWHLAHTAHSAQIWRIFWPVYHQPSKSGQGKLFLDLDSKNLIYGVAKNRSESPGSFHWCNNDLRPVVLGITDGFSLASEEKADMALLQNLNPRI